ncbi:DUF861 domain-containing protein [Pseudomaricurvus alkylphenolicus]|uniref:cupin domain-containing protein n=1 Tax=Pseudomaricurvus alkylphenolicus TaxID=1306991 RepID=UPI0014216A69|nr:cupin domain-containing protein [Pseudomaricurvus alkylphenolicus]NIB39430.1 DUF861 domain-containing protein [Pseudomaricurvus alkylphenolicus]
MSVDKISMIGCDRVDSESYLPDAEKIVEGNPAQTLWHCYDSKDQTFGAGIWQGEPGTHRVNYTEEEVCFLLQGRVVVTDNEGNTKELNQGDMFAIPAGFQGTWTTIESAKKLYVIYEK